MRALFLVALKECMAVVKISESGLDVIYMDVGPSL